MDYKTSLHKILKEYFDVKNIVSIKPYGDGLINHTFVVEFPETKYILQKINTYVFTSPIGVMHNIDLVTKHIRKKVIYQGCNYRYKTLTLIETKFDEKFAIVDDEYWRCYTCIDGVTYNTTTDPKIFYEAGVAVGEFQQLLGDFHTRLLSDNIKNFHNTPYRYETFKDIVKLDEFGRVSECTKEIDFIHSRADKMNVITSALHTGIIPRRVVHNDTKLNNIMFDKTGEKSLCLIDLDTVMKGSLVYDYGDAVRLGASNAKEDEADLSKVSINFDLVEAFTEGFMTAAKNVINEEEVKRLIDGYHIMTLELGMRFLTDYLDGDMYFELTEDQKESRPKINLERAKNQLKLVEEIERNREKLNNIVDKIWKKLCN